MTDKWIETGCLVTMLLVIVLAFIVLVTQLFIAFGWWGLAFIGVAALVAAAFISPTTRI